VYNSQAESGGTLELWMERSPGTPLVLFKKYPICMYSGYPGPKKKERDGQTPEGFYSFSAGSFNPSSNYRLSFNVGYPNARDRALRHTGGMMTVFGGCTSIGAFAMGDPYIDEIWTIAAAAANRGQRTISFHSFPFPMTRENVDIAVRAYPSLAAFWSEIQPGYDAFERTRQVPRVTVSGTRYMVAAVGEAVPASFDDRSGRSPQPPAQ
jgi:murein L,D-transpeptidase YafK